MRAAIQLNNGEDGTMTEVRALADQAFGARRRCAAR